MPFGLRFTVKSVFLGFIVARVLLLSSQGGLIWECENQDVRPANWSSRELATQFKFKNTGPAVVKITAVKTSCGCVVSTSEKRDYAPGEKGQIMATFNYGDRVGRQEKTIVVQTDDPAEPMKFLTLRVDIPQLLKIEPELVLWRVGEKAEAKSMNVSLAAGVDAKDLTVTSSNPDVEARLVKGEQDGKYTLVVTPKDTSHQLTAFIRVETGGENPKSFIAHVRIK